MKKNLVVFVLFAALFFAVSCDDGLKFNNPNDMNSDAYQGDKDSETPDDDGDQTDSWKENDDADSESVIVDNDIPDSSDDADTMPDESDTTADDDELTDDNDTTPDNGDTTPADETDTEPVQINPCDDNPCSGIANSTGSCAVTNGGYACGCLEHYSWTGSVCKADSRVADCTGRPANATWNTAESISQTWDGEEWYPSEAGTYNTNPSSSECRFKCEPDYDWNGSQCWKPVDPCDPNPCLNVANSTKECIETGDTTYSCKCNSGFNWTGSLCQSNSTPSLPECSTSNTGPCYDSTSHLTWSKKSDNTYNWSGAGTYCDGLSEGGNTDWRLPNISELRTLIKNCSGTQMPGGSCGVREDEERVCLSRSCQGEDCCSCSSDSTGGHSKFGDTGLFWSSSILSGSSIFAWLVNFSNGGVDYDHIDYLDYGYVRCVR